MNYTVPYGQHIEAAIRSLEKIHGCSRREALDALQHLGTDADLLDSAATIATEIEEEHQMSVHQIIATNRHNAATKIADDITLLKDHKKKPDLDSLLTRAFPGIPILIVLLFATLMTVFFVGSFLEEIIVELFDIYLVAPLLSAGFSPFWEQILFSLILAVQAGLGGIAFPFVFVFYILISILEDSGYMTRAAFLADRAMHHVGMHGQALIPMILGLGCNVPAIMSIRQLSKRERIIASVLITMVPCSARTVIIAGIVAMFVGVAWAFSIYLVVFILIILTGIVLTRITPGEQFGMILEMAPP